jgi:hypothetical protein
MSFSEEYNSPYCPMMMIALLEFLQSPQLALCFVTGLALNLDCAKKRQGKLGRSKSIQGNVRSKGLNTELRAEHLQ